MKYFAFASLAIALVSASARAQAEPLTLQNLRGLVDVSSISISADGSKVAFITSVGDYTHDRYDKRVMVVSASGGAPRALTGFVSGLADPQWSPSGERLAYLGDDAKGTAQVFTVSDGGGTSMQVTHAKRDVEQYAWNPRGTLIAYVAEDTPRDAAAFARHDDLWDVHDDGFLNTYAPEPSHIWLADATGGGDRRLTSGTWSVLEAAPPFVGTPTDPSWSADGTSIVFTMQSDADDSDSDRTSIALVNVDTGKVTKLDDRTHYEYQPVYAWRGDNIAYLYPHGPGPVSVLDVFVASKSANKDTTAELDRDVTLAGWLPDDRLLMMASDGPRTVLYVKSLEAAKATRIELGALNPSEFSIARTGAIAFVASATNKPSEVYILSSPGAAPRRLTDFNSPIEALDFGKSVEVRSISPDGSLKGDGILTYPVGYTAGKKYPLVLRIHGGPEAFTSLAFEPLRQLFAARGYLVYEPNYRGSDNLGSAYEHAIFGDPGVGPGKDVMAGVASLEKMGIVDTSHEAVTGHSYGGYMTTWLIGHWHHWRSAVVGDGMVDWIEEYDLSGTGNLAWARDSLGGSPWDPKVAPLYRSGSPITYVHDITTPTLIISGTADDQVPVSESYELYHALHDQGVPVRFVAIPTAKHHPSDPVRLEGYDRVTLDWVDQYMK
jgi:dipeptidyl aminopeptidase/acylaminoacyl peptidase